MRISVDPGVNYTGVAWWTGKGETLLGACGFKRGANEEKERFAVRIACGISATVGLTNADDSIQILIEFPEVYHNRAQQKGDQNDLLHLAYFVGVLRTELVAFYIVSHALFLVLPKQWKGQLDKDVSYYRINKKLSARELRLVELPKAKSLQHNVWDAVGIGLWKTKRALCR